MFIVIDRERLCILYKHENQTALVSLANIEVPEAAIVVMSATDPDSFERFTDFELKVLFENVCGQKHTGFNRPFLIKSIVALVESLDLTLLKPFEVEEQLLIAEANSDERWEYVYDSKVPSSQQDLFVPNALVTVAGYTPTPKRYHVPNERQSVFKAVAGVNPIIAAMYQSAGTDSSAPRAPRVRSEGPVTAPAVGSKTGRVWEIADQCFAKYSTLDKVLRKMVADACEAAGINSSTMSVQFSKWKQTKA